MAASAASHRPIKGILKNKGVTDSLSGLPPPAAGASAGPGSAACDDDFGKKSQKWDEMNILATYHPADKDYGLMKIDEPSTPYHSMIGDNDDDILSDSESNETLPPEVLAQKLSAAEGSEPKFLVHDDESSEEEDDLTPEEQEKRRQFEMKRKLHYNEGLNIKLARQLISKELRGDDEDEDEDDDTEMKPGRSSECQSQSGVP
ncbi:protein phosphatase inhibitor 2 isoform X2 [Vombatus ursinus]|uniref:Protein phosphatase 1 regulatory inhibitor subunit 2 n=1 Tax=Vombatus ursinus TaxID=29139 RepID=A0A4X2M930_VOMUR|nr:protein phosphatase inhibitor 2 isoform X2 [Vombatus ursinus]